MRATRELRRSRNKVVLGNVPDGHDEYQLRTYGEENAMRRLAAEAEVPLAQLVGCPAVLSG